MKSVGFRPYVLLVVFACGLALLFVPDDDGPRSNVALAGAADELDEAGLFDEVPGAPTFVRDIAPLVHANCTPCHHANGSAPFVLSDFDSVRKRANQLAIVTEDRFMPPWKPLPGFGTFADSRRLTDAEIELFARWADAGAPLGDPRAEPPPPVFDDRWQLGEPDLVVRLSEPVALPAEGRDVWTTLVVPLGLTEDRFVRAIECRPSNPQVLHHFMMFVDRQGLSHERATGKLVIGDEGMATGGDLFGEELMSESLMSWLPGATPKPLPADTAWRVPAGAELVLDSHFRTTGKEETCQLEFGIHFAEDRADRLPVIVYLAGEGMNIPPGVSDYTIRQEIELPVDVRLEAISAHAHYVCREIHGRAVLPDGSTVELLRIEDWDFEWQDTYRYENPLEVPAGTRIELDYVYDNSESNERNPFDPPRRVITGIRTTDEMAITWLYTSVESEDEQDELKELVSERWKEIGLASVRPLTLWRSIIETFDVDGDHTLDPDEEREATAWVKDLDNHPARVLRAFDRDGDGVLSPTERAFADRLIGAWF